MEKSRLVSRLKLFSTHCHRSSAVAASLFRRSSSPLLPLPFAASHRAAVAVGSAVGALLDPRRADLIAALGETTGKPAFQSVLERMKTSPEGRIKGSLFLFIVMNIRPWKTLALKIFLMLSCWVAISIPLLAVVFSD
ncbi:hypothetical protein Ddye_002134 [Dipteronia dyeriana]|uniref:Uncharacterized protein n=1 Tax=Dipteronia dyeriana TaxID=168575 RepID=A0AAD9XQI5_9ROSI|nr:hypothetical protein Ddye_002134 [Dipteronia dyeriana]